MEKRLLLIDAGHGDINEAGLYTSCPSPDKDNPNTWYKCMWNGDRWINEGEWNNDIAAGLGRLIENRGEFDFDFTKYGPEDISLNDRVAKEHEFSPDLFLSIHFNYFHKSTAKGTEVFAYENAGKGSRTAADIMAKNLMNDISEEPLRRDSNDRFYKEANFQVLRETKGAAVLVELGFFSNPDTQRMMKYGEYRDRLIESLYKSVKEYFNELG